MTKAELCELFPAFSPKRSIRKLNDGEETGYEVVGKWVRVEKVGDGWDVFLCNVRDMAKGISTKRLNLLVAKVPMGIQVHVLDGEAWWSTTSVNMVRAWLEANRVALGVAKRRPAVQNLRIGARNRPELSQATHHRPLPRAHTRLTTLQARAPSPTHQARAYPARSHESCARRLRRLPDPQAWITGCP